MPTERTAACSPARWLIGCTGAFFQVKHISWDFLSCSLRCNNCPITRLMFTFQPLCFHYLNLQLWKVWLQSLRKFNMTIVFFTLNFASINSFLFACLPVNKLKILPGFQKVKKTVYCSLVTAWFPYSIHLWNSRRPGPCHYSFFFLIPLFLNPG